jgi:ATP-dependent exoDNAse (exonuclease V) beta subunit
MNEYKEHTTNNIMPSTMLKDVNPHPRDRDIKFYDKGHIYYVKRERGYKSVTTVVHNLFEKFNADKIIDNMMASPKWPESKYFGMTKQEIKDSWNKNRDSAASSGTNMHAMFENYYNGIKNEDTDTIEFEYFNNFIADHQHLVPYRTEWNVFHEDVKLAGSIDMVYINEDGTLSIYDWKRCKSIDRHSNFNKKSIHEKLQHIPDTNYWHYSLQLNIYKTILEEKYGFVVKDLHLVVIHPENADNYEKIQLPILNKEIQTIFTDLRKA